MSKISKSELVTGNVILYCREFKWNRPMSYVSAAIRFVMKSKISHVSVIVSDWGEPFCNQALPSGVHAIPATRDLVGERVIILKYKGEINEKEFATRANSYLGMPYDFFGTCVCQLVYQLSGRTIWIGKRGRDAGAKLYCFEYAALMFPNEFSKPWEADVYSFLDDSKFEIVFDGAIESVDANK